MSAEQNGPSGDRESDPGTRASPPPDPGTTMPDAVPVGLTRTDADGGAPRHPSPGLGASNGFRNGPGSFRELASRWSAPPDGAGSSLEPAATVVAAPVVHSGGTTPPDDDEEETQESDAVRVDEVAAPIRARCFGRTDVGLVRDHNEDNFLLADLDLARRDLAGGPIEASVGDRGLIFAVCDGMGGAAAGEVASQMAVDTIHEVMGARMSVPDRDAFARCLVHAVEEAGHRIFSAAKMDRTRRGMGTTATLAGLVDHVLFVGQVGDSRAYVLRGDAFVQITKDQSLVNQLIEAGQLTEEEAEAFEHSNIILQALGTTEEVTVDLTFLELRRGDRLLLCSDGLSGLVHADAMQQVVSSTEDLAVAADQLIDMANKAGGHDNITVILVDFDGVGLGTAPVAPSYQQYPLPPDDTSRSSAPPRATSIKAGGPKPGADVKRAAPLAGTPIQVAPMSTPTRAAGNGWMLAALAIGLVLVLVAVALLFVVGGFAAFGLTGAGSDDKGGLAVSAEDAPPTAPEPVPTSADEGEAAPPAEAVVLGTLRIESDIPDGTVYVGGEPVGPIRDGMEIPLRPNAFRVDVRHDDAQIVERTVTVTAGETTTVVLNREQAPDHAPLLAEPAVEEPVPGASAPVATEPSATPPPRPAPTRPAEPDAAPAPPRAPRTAQRRSSTLLPEGHPNQGKR
ncbi:MAG: Stp1/IreP family PP2C-type Ser/Thr phosphatase, partial [Sandaracinaceae bacterium]